MDLIPSIASITVLLFTLLLELTLSESCSKERCRAVRSVVQDKLRPVYTTLELEVPRECPFSSERDMYAIQEANIFKDSDSKWICQFCGKSFYEVRYLDHHLDVRHAHSQKTGDDVTCLSDYCDVFRCDVLSGRHQPRYWDVALCDDSEMSRVAAACRALREACAPRDVDQDRREKLATAFNHTLCDYLTCDKYWKQPDGEVNPVTTALYIIFGLFLSFALMIYYYVVYTHFYTDESLLSSYPARERRSSLHGSAYASHYPQDLRVRSNVRYT